MRKKTTGFWQIAGVLLLAVVLRIPLLNGSFWLDEAAQALESARPLSQQLDIAADFQPPLIHLLTFATIRVSHQEWWLRTWTALIPGLLSIFFTFLIGKRLHSPKAGLIAAALLSTSSFHIFYSQELRPYALPLLWGTVSWWLLLSWLDTAKRKQLVWLTIVTILGLYSSFLYPFLLLAQLGWGFWQTKNNRGTLLASFCISALGFAPWLPMFMKQLEAGGMVRTQLPTWASVVSTPQLKIFGLLIGKFLFGVLNIELTWFYGLLCGGVALLTTLLIKGVFQQKNYQ